MDVDIELRLEERCEDRVRVSFSLAPVRAGAAKVEGAEIRLVDAEGVELCPRALLPIAGRVTGPMSLMVELRTRGKLPVGARVVATAWSGRRQALATCPADPFVSLRDHLLGARIGMPEADEILLEPLAPELRARLACCLPWLDQPLRAVEVAGVLEAEVSHSAEDLASELGLDPEQADWLADLLDEDDPPELDDVG